MMHAPCHPSLIQTMHCITCSCEEDFARYVLNHVARAADPHQAAHHISKFDTIA